MSIKYLLAAMNARVGSSGAKLVLIALADNADNDKGKCWPSVRSVSEKCEMSEKTVRDHIGRLVEIGYVSIQHRSQDGVSLPNVYSLNLQAMVDRSTETSGGVGSNLQGGWVQNYRGVGSKLPTNLSENLSIEPKEDSSLRSLSHSSENDLFEQTGNGTGNQLIPIAKPAAEPPGDHARFVEFWNTYPKRLGTNSRKEASAKFSRAVKAGTDPATIIAGAARYAAHCDETGKTSTDKVQQATTWLNQANWETDYGRQQLNNRQQSNGRAIQGNPVLANAITRLEERRLRFTDPETGAYDNRAADAFGEAERDRIRAQFYPNTFGRG